jgi:hypothetical protein
MRTTALTRTLFEGLVDYAGLFPPARLDMGLAVRQYAEHLASDVAWMLGRFIVPSARLEEFEGAASTALPHESAIPPWRLSVLGGADSAEDAERVWAFNERHAHKAAGLAVIDTMEVRAGDLTSVLQAARAVPAGIQAYIEIPITNDPTDLIGVIAAEGARAKVRTGGVTMDAFPSPLELARFIRTCTDRSVAFKATAGLHHPLRGSYRLTYEPHSAAGEMYGFLNVFLAAAFAKQGLRLDELEQLLLESERSAFRFDDSGVSWRARRLSLEDVSDLRTRVAAAFGSCSFEEPVSELRALHLL